MGDNIPKTQMVNIFFPKSKKRDTEKLLTLLNSQNQGLCTHIRKVLDNKEEGSVNVLTIGIDERSASNIKKGVHTIFYRFGNITIHGLKYEERKSEKRKTLEEKSNPTVRQKSLTERFISNYQSSR